MGHRWARRLFARYIERRVVELSDIGRGFLSLQRDSQDEIADMKSAEIPEELQKKLFSILGEEIRVNIDRMRKCLDDLAAAYPEEYSKAMTMKAARMMLCNERHVIRNLTYDGIMSKKDGDMMEDSIDTRSEKLM